MATLALGWFGAWMVRAVAKRMSEGLASLADRAHASVAPIYVVNQLWSDAALVAQVSGPLALVAGLASVAASIAQVGWGWSPKARRSDLGSLESRQGLRKFAPLQAGPNTLKAVFGMVVVGWVAWLLIRDFYWSAPGLMGMAPVESAAVAWQTIWRLLWQVGLALVVLGALDYGVQYWRWFMQLKMTRKEVMDEVAPERRPTRK